MSLQQDHYLAARAAEKPVDEACALAGIPASEAVLIEKDIARGAIELPLQIPAAGLAVISKESHMAKKTKPGDGVTNLSETKDIVRNAVPKIINLKEQRKQLNAEIAEIREKVNAAGVPKKALDHAIRVKEMDPEDRQRFDEGYAIARDAIGVPHSRSLFDTIEEPTRPANNDRVDETEDAAA